MADGKLQIKGTITIKSGKSKGTKKKRKPRKKKTTTEPYTGVPLGTAQTKQEFGQPAYTAQALMTAMALRGPQIQQQAMEQQQGKPQRIEQPRYYQLEDIQNIPLESTIQMTKQEFMSKAAPFLEREIQTGIEERKKKLEKNLEQQQYETSLRMEEIQRDFMRQQQFFENELEAKQDYFQKELADLELRANTEKERMQLERIHDKASFIAESVIDKGLFNVMSSSQKAQLKEQAKELQRVKEETASSVIKGEIEVINSLSTAQLRQRIKEQAPGMLFDKDGNYLTTDEYRTILLQEKGLIPYVRQVQTTVGRPTVRYQFEPSVTEQFKED